jgi:uncharacterized caspase-like protein
MSSVNSPSCVHQCHSRAFLYAGTAALCLLVALPAHAQAGVEIVAPSDRFDPYTVYGKSHALVIGIDKYPSIQGHDLSYAVDDATAVAQRLKDVFGFQDVILLRNEEATKDAIHEAIMKLTDKKNVAENDRVLVYFSGHGYSLKVGGNFNGFLIPEDATGISLGEADNPRPLNELCFSMESVRGWVKTIPALHVLLIADACFSGFLAMHEALEPEAGTGADWAHRNAHQFITAGTASQPAKEGPEWKHGAFTYYLLVLQRRDFPIRSSPVGSEPAGGPDGVGRVRTGL